MARKIIQGEQYPMPFILTLKGVTYTPENVTELRAKLGGFSAFYPNGDLVYRNGAWQFPLTQEMSYQLKSGLADFQVQGKTSGGNILSTDITKVTVNPTIFGGAW
jgi:hypothetical protein